jgi:hypothetical protein
MAGGEFDVETTEEDGDLHVKAAAPQPPAPQVETPSAASEEMPRPKIGRPRGSTKAAIQSAAPAASADAPLPKNARDMWIAILAKYAEESRLADDFVMYVYRMTGPQLQPLRMTERIYGEQVGGDPEAGLNPGDALIDWLTDYYHMGMTTTAASYRIEFCWKTTGLKIAMSDPWPLDAPASIEKMRGRLQAAASRARGPGYYEPAPPPPRRVYYPPQPPQPHLEPPVPQQQHSGATPAAPAAAAPVVTGDPHLDRLISMQEEQRRTDREDARRREEEQRIEFERREAELQRQINEMRMLQTQGQPTTSPPVVESEEVRQARADARTAQIVVQALVAMGFKPPAQEPALPPQTPTQQVATVNAQSTSTSALEQLVDEVDRVERVKKKMRKVLGLPEEEEEAEEPEETPPVGPKDKTQPVRRFMGSPIAMPYYDPDEDEPSNVQRVVDFFSANPGLTREIAGQVLNAVMGKLSPDMVTKLLGSVMGQGGAPGLAAASIQGSMNGAGGGTFQPPTA